MKNKVILLVFNKDLSSMAFQLKGPLRAKSPKLHIPIFETDYPIEDIGEFIQEQIGIRFGFRTNQLVRNYINDQESTKDSNYLIYTCIYPCHPGPVTPTNVASDDWFYMIELSKITDGIVDMSEIPNGAEHILQACKNPKMFKNDII